MRTYGRVLENGVLVWREVSSTPEDGDARVWLTTLIQCLKLVTGESPFYANHGIPSQQSVLQQVFPDFFVAQTQRQFSQYFAALIIAKTTPSGGDIAKLAPAYRVNVTLPQGARIDLTIPVPG